MPRLNLFKITIPVLIAIFLFGTTCKKTTEDKQPVSNFSFDKAEYIAGEIIRITNTSVDASSYTWTLPDGTTTKSKDLDYTTAANIGNANLNFKLEAYSKGGKVDYSVKSVRVKAATGQLVIYDGYSPSYFVQISIDGVNVGNAVLPLGTPICGQSGYSTYTLSAGTHYLRATGGPYSGTIQTFQINANECTVLRIVF